jgi:uncharacterized protein involved in exopolysaccharide biosynthesis
MNEEKKVTFSDYLYVIYKWKKFLIINMLIILIITAILTLMIDNKYRAKAVVMIPTENNIGGALGGLLSDATSFLGGGLLGSSGEAIDKMLGILNSRTVMQNVVQKFNLVEYYKLKDEKRDKSTKALREDSSFDLNQNGMIEITMIHKDSVISAQIVNYFVQILDSLNRSISSIEAKNYRIFVENRYDKNLKDLALAEDAFEKFQEEHGIYVIPDQVQFAVEAVGKFEAQLFEMEMRAHLLESMVGKSAPAYKELELQINQLKEKLKGFKQGDDFIDESIAFFPFDKVPEIQKIYLRLFREIEIQSKILELTLPMYEHAVMEEQKSIPTIMILDSALPPQHKYSPKRSFIVIGIGLLFGFLHIIFIFIGEKLVTSVRIKNPLDVKGSNFYNRLAKIYRLKIDSV